jgi:hypothetical protein
MRFALVPRRNWKQQVISKGFPELIVGMRSRKESAQAICRQHPRHLSELTTRAGASITWSMIEIWPL